MPIPTHKEQTATLTIVIPTIDSPFREHIHHGSGIVMFPTVYNTVTSHIIYYEGNLYHAINLQYYEDRIRCAAGRAHQGYPTSAMMGLMPFEVQQFIPVGNCYPNDAYWIHLDLACRPIIDEWTKERTQ